MGKTYETLKCHLKKTPFSKILRKWLKKRKKGTFLGIFEDFWVKMDLFLDFFRKFLIVSSCNQAKMFSICKHLRMHRIYSKKCHTINIPLYKASISLHFWAIRKYNYALDHNLDRVSSAGNKINSACATLNSCSRHYTFKIILNSN
jgi:hypothetical protein